MDRACGCSGAAESGGVQMKPLLPVPCSYSGRPEGLGMQVSQAYILMKDKERKKLKNILM